MNRRSFVQASVAAVAASQFPTVSARDGGVAGAATGPQQASGLVWSQRDPVNGTQALFDVVTGREEPYAFCGYGTSYDEDRTILRVTDQWGRLRSQRRGADANQRGDRGYEFVPLDDGYLVAGVDNDAPMLAGLDRPLAPVSWQRTYDGTPDGPVHAATTGDVHAVGWMNMSGPSADVDGATVVGTGGEGDEQWSDRPAENRRLTELISVAGGETRLVAVGTPTEGASDSPGGWATVWRPDGTRERDVALETPGSGPAAAVADGGAVVLAGTSTDGFWLQRRAADWSVEWTRRYAADGGDRGVDDVVVRADGYGLLAHDAAGTVVLRTDAVGEERWRGRYAPYTDGHDVADRGHAMVPVDGDEFVVAGSTAPGEEGRDWWAARVGEPGATTPAETPEPTDTPGPTTTPPPGDGTPGTTVFPTEPPTTGPTSTAPTDETGVDGGEGEDATATSGSGPGFGVVAALAGLAGLAAARWRDD